MSTALRSVGRLDVLSSTPAAPSGRAPCIHARLHRLATKSGEKSGLVEGLHVHVAIPDLAAAFELQGENSLENEG